MAWHQAPRCSPQHLRLCRDLAGEGPGAMLGTMRQAAASIEDKARRHRRQQYLCIRGSSALNSLSHTEAFKLSVVRWARWHVHHGTHRQGRFAFTSEALLPSACCPTQRPRSRTWSGGHHVVNAEPGHQSQGPGLPLKSLINYLGVPAQYRQADPQAGGLHADGIAQCDRRLSLQAASHRSGLVSHPATCSIWCLHQRSQAALPEGVEASRPTLVQPPLQHPGRTTCPAACTVVTA